MSCAERGHPFGYPVRMWDSRLSARTDSGYHSADRLEITKLGADLFKTHVHYKQRWTLPFDKTVNVTLNPRRSARIDFPYGRHIRFVRILSSTTELHPRCPEDTSSGCRESREARNRASLAPPRVVALIENREAVFFLIIQT